MARFPRTEPEIAALALLVTEGLAQAPEDFPTPPVAPDQMQARLDAYNATLTATVAAQAALRELHAAKDDALEKLVDGLKASLKYAEIAVRDQPEKLTRLGWGERSRGSALEAPGEVRNITIAAEGDTWTVLRWKSPVDGGAVGFYKIRRQLDDGPWEDADTSTNTEQLISDQPRGVEIRFHVIAANKAGEGKPSGTVTMVL